MAKDPRTSWYKIFIPELQEVMCGIFIDPNITATFDPFPFVYARLDSEHAAFDTELAVAMYALDGVILLGKDPNQLKVTEMNLQK